MILRKNEEESILSRITFKSALPWPENISDLAGCSVLCLSKCSPRPRLLPPSLPFTPQGCYVFSIWETGLEISAALLVWVWSVRHEDIKMEVDPVVIKIKVKPIWVVWRQWWSTIYEGGRQVSSKAQFSPKVPSCPPCEIMNAEFDQFYSAFGRLYGCEGPEPLHVGCHQCAEDLQHPQLDIEKSNLRGWCLW